MERPVRNQYLALIKDTILKESRSKTLMVIFIFTTLAIILGQLGLSFVVDNLSAENGFSLQGQQTLSLTFRILNSLSFLIAVILGINVIRSDYNNNIIYQYLSFPISRSEYFFSRVIGAWVIAISYYLYAYLLSAILYSITFKSFILSANHLAGFLILCLYLLIIIFLSIFFSLFMNKIGALFVTAFVCIISAASYASLNLLSMSEMFSNLNIFKVIGLLFYGFFPRAAFLDNLSSSFLSGDPFGGVFWAQSLHLIVILALYGYIAHLYLKKKDF